MSGYHTSRGSGGDRHNGWGAAPGGGARRLGSALSSTRDRVAHQPAAAPFATAPATRQWQCACGMVNAIRRERCRACGGHACSSTREGAQPS